MSRVSCFFAYTVYTAHVLWPAWALSRKIKRHHYCLKHLNETSYEVRKRINQQRSALVKHVMKCYGSLPLSPTYVLSLNRQWSIIRVSDRLLDAWPTVIQNVASTRQYITKNFNRFTPIARPRFCNLRTKVWNVRNSQVGRYNWSPAFRDKAAQQWLCVHCDCAGPLYF